MTDIIVEIKSTCMDGDMRDVTYNRYRGRLEHKNGKHYIVYDEDESIGAAGVHTMLKADGNNSVVMRRTGALCSCICIEPGVRSRCAYQTVLGETELFFTGNSIENMLDSSGKLIMCYTIEAGSAIISRNTVEILIKEE